MKLVYFGTPDMAVPPLQALVAAGHDVVLVVTRVDKRRGRGSGVSPSPVKAAALELGLDVSHDPDDALIAGADLGVVVAYGRLIRPPLLDRLPMVNAHFSLLPRWRGAAPVERALLAGDEVTGVCVMRLEETLDTGGVYARAEVPIGPTTTAVELRAQLVEVACELLVDQLARPLAGWIDDAEPQRGEVTTAAKFAPADFEIDWTRSVDEIDRLIRVGGAWTTFRGKRLKIHQAFVRDGVLVPAVVQPEGRGPMDFEAWRRGARPVPGEPFGPT